MNEEMTQIIVRLFAVLDANNQKQDEIIVQQKSILAQQEAIRRALVALVGQTNMDIVKDREEHRVMPGQGGATQ